MSLSGAKITTFKQTPTMDRQGTDPPTCIMMPDATGGSATSPTSLVICMAQCHTLIQARHCKKQGISTGTQFVFLAFSWLVSNSCPLVPVEIFFPTTGWQYYNWDTRRLTHDASLTVSPGPLPPLPRQLTVTASGAANEKWPTSSGMAVSYCQC